MSKWAALSVNPPTAPQTFKGWTTVAWVAAAAAVGVAVAMNAGTKRSSPKAVSRAARAAAKIAKAEPATVLQPKAVPEDIVVADAADAVVEPKAGPMDPTAHLWHNSEPVQDDAPEFETEMGLRVSDFQQAFYGAREKPITDARLGPSSLAADALHAALAAGDDVTDAMLVAAAGSQNVRSTYKADAMTPEAMQIAREAMQVVDPRMPADVAVDLLREVLAARTEAMQTGIQLPEASDDQLAAFKYWSGQRGRAAELAQVILSRL